MAEVRVSGVTKSFGLMKALDDVTLDFPNGKFFGLLGPSGSGKTTLLRTIAGFSFADSGSVIIGDEPVENVPVEKREIGMVFQNYALFPNMTVAENVAFGLKVRRRPAAEIEKKVAEDLELVQLGHLGGRRPQQLSGGQRQRVALARAIVTQPRVLLLDEPLSALDKALRVDMQIELKRIQREIGITTIFVTHDQEEALTLSDHIGILKDGKLVQHGAPREVYNAPINEFSARFLGEANIFHGNADGNGFHCKDGTVIKPAGQAGPEIGAIAVRPESLTLSAAKPADNDNLNLIRAHLDQKIFAGAMATCVISWQGRELKVLAKDHELQDVPDSGDIWLSWPRDKSISLPAG